MSKAIKNSQKFHFASAILAALLWGGWSLYINYSPEQGQQALLSGVVQGTCSFMITLLIGRLLECQFNFFATPLFKVVLPPLLTVLLTGSGLVLIHHLINTPNILKTVTPALSVALLFAFFSNFKLYQQIEK